MKLKGTKLIEGTLLLEGGRRTVIEGQVIEVPDAYEQEPTFMYAITKGWLEKVADTETVSVVETITEDSFVNGGSEPPKKGRKVVKIQETVPAAPVPETQTLDSLVASPDK